MAKSAEAFRTISEVAEELNVQKHVLRFWETRFPQLRPMKRGGGRRYYRPEDLRLLRGIKYLLHEQGYQIKGVQRILRDEGIEHVKRSFEQAATGSAAEKAPVKAAPAKKGRAKKPAKVAESAGALPLGAQDILRSAIADLEACRSMLLGVQAADGEVQQDSRSGRTQR